jgi:hypothetical protein
VKRLVLLNAFPVSAFQFDSFTAHFRRASLAELAAESKNAEVVSYIRHPATVAALSRVLPHELKPEAGFYSYRAGDVIYVATLRQLPARGVEVATVKQEDLDIVKVEIKQ